MTAAIFGALKYLPKSVARQSLEKYNPAFKSYFSKALAYGFDAGSAIDYLSDRFETDQQREYQEKLEKGAANNTLRPDEQVSRSTIGNQKGVEKLARNGLAIATGGLLGARGEQGQREPELQQAEAPYSQQSPGRVGYSPRQQLEDQRFASMGQSSPGTINVPPTPEQQGRAAQIQNLQRARARSPIGREALQEDVQTQDQDVRNQILQGLREVAQRLGV